jgi:DNA/RNA endonuclease G (NUC1)
MLAKSVTALFAAALVAIATSYAAAQSDGDWKPTKENDPTTCSKIWQVIGLPLSAAASADKTTVCHDRFVLSNDNASKTPDWVVEHLQKKELTNAFSRPAETFNADKHVPPHGQPVPDDYAGTADKFHRSGARQRQRAHHQDRQGRQCLRRRHRAGWHSDQHRLPGGQ